ncbi:MAG: DUF4956 domain-containing protein [Gemmatimonadales bacterium]
MDQFLRQAAGGDAFGLGEVIVALALSFALCLMLAYFYRQSHRGLSYSVSFVHAMIFLGVTVSIIMLIIGSNIARAFTLVGALSIIRFRNPIKDSRDVAFIFVAMAIGMSVGTGFYLTAIVFTLFACFMAYTLTRFEIGSTRRREMLLKVHVPESADFNTLFGELFYRSLREHALLSVEPIREGGDVELVYSLEFKPKVDEAAFLAEVRQRAEGRRVALLTGQDNIDV